MHSQVTLGLSACSLDGTRNRPMIHILKSYVGRPVMYLASTRLMPQGVVLSCSSLPFFFVLLFFFVFIIFFFFFLFFFLACLVIYSDSNG